MENYLNILFIRSRPNSRYIFRRGRQALEVAGIVKMGERRKTKEKLWRRMVERGWSEEERERKGGGKDRGWGRDCGSESPEKGCNEKEGEGTIGPLVSLLGIYNPMISFCTPVKPSYPRYRPWVKRSHARVADIMVYCSQWCSNTFHCECLCATVPINLRSLKDLSMSYVWIVLKEYPV